MKITILIDGKAGEHQVTVAAAISTFLKSIGDISGDFGISLEMKQVNFKYNEKKSQKYFKNKLKGKKDDDRQ